MTSRTCKDHPMEEPKLVLTPKLKHYGKWCCPVCDKYIVWARNPETDSAIEDRRAKLRNIIRIHSFDDHELEEILKLYVPTHLNLVQEKKYKDILNNLEEIVYT